MAVIFNLLFDLVIIHLKFHLIISFLWKSNLQLNLIF